MIVVFALLWIVLLVPLGAELVKFAEGLPALTAQVQAQADSTMTAFRSGAPVWVVQAADSALASISASLGDIGTSAANGVLAAGGSLLGFFGSLLMGMIVGFFLLMSLPEVTWSATHLVPSRIRSEVLEIARRSYGVLASWLKGTAITSGIIGGVCVIGFALVGLPFAIPLGIITGLTDIVPYIGPLFAGVLVFLIGLTKGWVTAALAIAVLLAVQQSTDMFIGPRIQSDATGLHPAVVVLALLAGSAIAGIPGMLAAIPVAGIAQAVFQFYSDKYHWTEPLPEPPGSEQAAQSAE
jgi:predicted PurR-regulated permease PerM